MRVLVTLSKSTLDLDTFVVKRAYFSEGLCKSTSRDDRACRGLSLRDARGYERCIGYLTQEECNKIVKELYETGMCDLTSYGVCHYKEWYTG